MQKTFFLHGMNSNVEKETDLMYWLLRKISNKTFLLCIEI